MPVIVTDAKPLSQWIRRELQLPTSVKRGSRGKSVKRIQEWLTLRGYGVTIDGDFGPVTKATVQDFQRDVGLPGSGVVTAATFAALREPLGVVLQPIEPDGHTFASLTMAYARQHLDQHPLEVGGDNLGPWVRLYAEGNEGKFWYWCAYFVTFVMRQAAETMGVKMPIRGSGSCDALAAQAKEAGLFVSESDYENGRVADSMLKDGAVFLVRKTATDWTHTGLVTEFGDDRFLTIEGNTNDDGHRNGYEVCSRSRGYKKRDFILLP